MRIREIKYESYFPAKQSREYKMKCMFKKNNATKRRKLNKNEHKAMIIPNLIFKTNKELFVTVNTQSVCTLGFSVHIWLPFLNQPQSDVVVLK